MQTLPRLLFCAIVLALPAQALAESAATRAACTPSVLMLCPAAAAAGDREAAKVCLLKKLGRASRRCQAAVRAEPPEPSDAASPRK